MAVLEWQTRLFIKTNWKGHVGNSVSSQLFYKFEVVLKTIHAFNVLKLSQSVYFILWSIPSIIRELLRNFQLYQSSKNVFSVKSSHAELPQRFFQHKLTANRLVFKKNARERCFLQNMFQKIMNSSTRKVSLKAFQVSDLTCPETEDFIIRFININNIGPRIRRSPIVGE